MHIPSEFGENFVKYDVSRELFFEAVHPAYPVFDRSKFVELYLENKASPLILHTIYFMAYTVGSDDIFRSAGYQDRITAKTFHYERAKALFDCDYDTDDTRYYWNDADWFWTTDSSNGKVPIEAKTMADLRGKVWDPEFEIY